MLLLSFRLAEIEEKYRSAGSTVTDQSRTLAQVHYYHGYMELYRYSLNSSSIVIKRYLATLERCHAISGIVVNG